MTRWWNEFVGALTQIVNAPLLLLGLVLVATAVALLWYFFPAWVPRRWPRIRLRKPSFRFRWSSFRWRWTWKLRWPPWRRRKKKKTIADAEEPAQPGAEELPDLPVADFRSLADRYAAEGRYAEAVRERLRGMVRELIDRGVITHQPGWTVTELASAAAARRPAVAAPLDEAGRIFSEIWYGQRPATADHDARMRQLAAQLSTALSGAPAGVAG